MSSSVDDLKNIKSAFVEQLKKKRFLKKVISGLNDNVDIPLLSEKNEKTVFKSIVKSFIDVIEAMDFDGDSDDE